MAIDQIPARMEMMKMMVMMNLIWDPVRLLYQELLGKISRRFPFLSPMVLDTTNRMRNTGIDNHRLISPRLVIKQSKLLRDTFRPLSKHNDSPLSPVDDHPIDLILLHLPILLNQ
jgi:hypothetical protein